MRYYYNPERLKRIVKSLTAEYKRLAYFKKELLAQLEKQEAKEQKEKLAIKKAIRADELMYRLVQKAGFGVGTVREWRGKKYKKVAQGKWRRIYDKEDRGAKMSIARLKKQVEKCESTKELLDLVLQNKSRFMDENGKPLPIVKELSAYAKEKGREKLHDKRLEAAKKTDKKYQNLLLTLKDHQRKYNSTPMPRTHKQALAGIALYDKIENDRKALKAREAELKEATKRGTDEPKKDVSMTKEKIELVKSPSGKKAFGEFDSDQLNAMGIKNSTGKIVLPKGDSSFGLEHIKKHEKEVKKFGYKDIEHFVYSMCNTFESIKKASDTNEGNKTFVLLREYDKKHDGTLFLEFQVQERKGKKNVFVVTSGGVFKSKNKKKFEDVWTDHPIQSQSKGETADSDTSVENSPITEANRQTTADNSSIADNADSVNEDLPENASSWLDKGVAEIRKHYEGKYGLEFYASPEGEVYLSNEWSPNDLNESELRDCAKVLDSIKKEYDAIHDAPLDKAERFSSFLGSAHAEQLKDRVNARLDELEAKRAVLVFNKDMAASVDLTSLRADVEETFHHSIKWANSVGIEWAEIARPVTRINELIKNSPEAKRFIQKLADIDENDNLEDLSDLYKEALYNHFAKAGLFLTKFSNLSDKQKDEKKKQIQSFPVASIEKDTVAYNGDGKFGNAAKEWLEQNPLGNASTEIGEVVINKAAVDKDLHHGAKENLYTKLQTLPAIKDVLEKGTYLGYEGNRTSNDKIDNHYFAGKIRYGDKEKIIFCRVKNAAGDKNRFYVHEVFTEDEIKKEASNTVADVDPSLLTGTPLYKFILQDVLNVKGDSTVKKAFDRFFAQWTA